MGKTMKLDRETAAQSLAAMKAVEMRSGSFYGYAIAAPYIFLAGLTWLAADLVYFALPEIRRWVWPAASLLVAAGSFSIAARQSMTRERGLLEAGQKQKPALDAHFWRSMALSALAAAFGAGSLYVLTPVSGEQVHSFIALALGSAYAAAGLWLGVRILATGLGIAVLTLVGHAFAGDVYTLYMAAVGGGGMMLSAWWLRKV